MHEWQGFKSLPDDNLPTCASLEHFWFSIGEITLPAGEVGENVSGIWLLQTVASVASSTADPE